ncbi:PilT/PilU family type 4a pilus ATPase [Nitrosomonadales bacterium]|nr:PilT/PilU family type 4a pilus ATPase [Nitrosomonadales bacterium]
MLWPLILQLAEKTKLSDIHIHSDAPIAYREFGDMVQLDDHVVEESHIREFLQEVLDDDEFAHFIEHKDHDFAIEKDGKRFRVNAFQETIKFALILRRIESDLPKFDDLGLPAYIRTIPTLDTGLVLVTGETGSGKSTTLAALIDVINATKKGHIITIEDPIEFQHNSKESVMTQREVGRDTKSFSNALRAALREDPDVILVGELRDVETISLALTAAETGHLVFGTLHSNSAPSTINRIIDVFPPEQQGQVQSQLASSLRCVLTQRLLKTIDKPGRVAAFELMICNTAIQSLIRENKIFQITNTMQMGKAEGQMLMENSLKDLISQKRINPADAE